MAKKTNEVWAAGGVVWRPVVPGPTGNDAAEIDDVEIAVVHRPEYDDWTLPKGKAEPGETLIDTAVREIAEETGQHVVLGRHLDDVHYDLGSTRKHVRYWSARASDGEFVAGHRYGSVGVGTFAGQVREFTFDLTPHPADRDPEHALPAGE